MEIKEYTIPEFKQFNIYFTLAEVTEMVKLYIRSKGVACPDGDMCVTVMDNRNDYHVSPFPEYKLNVFVTPRS